MAHDDVATLANPEDRGLHVTRLDCAAWEEWRQVVPVSEPLGAEGWARVIRERGLRVAVIHDGLLPLESPWPAGQVVVVSAVDGTQRSHVAVPRPAFVLASDLAVETDRTLAAVSGPCACPPAGSLLAMEGSDHIRSSAALGLRGVSCFKRQGRTECRGEQSR